MPPAVQPRLCPTFRYRDAAAMIDWLSDAFGFSVHARHVDDAGVIQHAELMLGPALIMVSTSRPDDFCNLVGEPGENGGKSVYIAIDDVDAAYLRAKSAGAEIARELVHRDYGSREFICRDPEGNIWSFGTYWPEALDA